ncbi:ABC transporter substrate-binding protein [Mangrovihabitans endophyticus]|uniref:Sugar ABC transporter substrate-binding protein n=1 Tax=Mangrovihabitans endophyticus TaxID=1751298 RepID=A0A8J3BVT2_9ACTN|nr:extracellular solute-binding protein [Mangrovihabitans endophyticus]GGK80849.1 sugar ABC transporter substrate-binding protein [Mangrovihabitans endophyticus]
MFKSRLRSALGVLLVAGIGLSTAACGDDADSSNSDGPVTLVINGLPPATEKANHDRFLANVAEFEKANPTIKIDAREGKMDPQTFPAKLAGGQLEDVFYVYFTDPANLIAKHQVSDVSDYLKDFPITSQIKPEVLRVFQDGDGHTYGLPYKNYSMGLLYNRDVFSKAGLDPENPPKTWADVRTAAKKISDLGDGYIGYGDYSKSNTGGWHFTTEMYSIGGDVAVNQDGTWKAAFNNAKGKQVLQQLKDMRWTDNSMGQKQLLEWADLLQQMGSGKLGMYLATADNIPTIVNQYKGKYETYGLGPIPGGQGTLGGGEGYMFKAGLSPAKIKAGLKWLTFWFTSADRYAAEDKWSSENDLPVGLPEPAIFTGDAAQIQAKADKQYANVPQENYAPFVADMGSIPVKLEPPNAQQIYAVLDVPMQKVLTDKNADIDQLLADAEKQVNSILAGVK